MMIGKIDNERFIDLDRVWEIQVHYRPSKNQWETRYIYNVKEDKSWDVYHATEEEALAQIITLYGRKLVPLDGQRKA